MIKILKKLGLDEGYLKSHGQHTYCQCCTKLGEMENIYSTTEEGKGSCYSVYNPSESQKISVPVISLTGHFS